MEPIAITGMACLFPGAASPAELWQNLAAGRDTTSPATAAKLGVDPGLLYDPARGKADRFYALRGGYVTGVAFDPGGYRLPAERLAGLDDLYAWSLLVTRQALADGGALRRDEALARCGLILGNLSFPTAASGRLFAPLYRRAVERGLDELLGAGRVRLGGGGPGGRADDARIAGYPAALAAEALGLGAGWFALDAACASSLYAIKLACAYLAAGKADLMVAGAVSCADPVFIKMGFSIFQAYPENGVSRPLDRSSQGLTSGEGAGALLLKRYADAVRDGDRIYAVVRGVGLSNDGAGRHVLAPNPKGQMLAYERAYGEAGLAPEQIAAIECHATGTPVGDLTELHTVEAFFGPRGHIPLLGSVKSNFGHLLTAAGMAGTIKMILSMEHGAIPPTIGVDEPLATRSGEVGPGQIVRALTPWPAAGPRRAAVSAFGFGGTNAHLVLERAEARPDAWAPPPSAPPAAPGPLAIVGIEASFGPWSSLAALEAGIVGGERALRPLPPARWKGLERDAALLRAHGLAAGEAPQGAYVDSFTLDSLRYKIPPADGDQPIPQQLLILDVADGALRDAGVRRGANVAVLVAMEAELASHQFGARISCDWQLPQALERAGVQLAPAERARFAELVKDSLHGRAEVNQYTSFIGNLMACRIAALWDFSGPALTISAEEGGCFRALEVAQLLLAQGVDAVVVGAVDLAGGLEQVLANGMAGLLAGPGAAPGHDEGAAGWLVGEGAGAIVLRRQGEVAAEGGRSYATLEALSVVAGARDRAGAVARAAGAALGAVAVAPRQVGYLELWASGAADEDAAELAGLAAVYGGAAGEPQRPGCAVGSAKANVGHAGAAAGIAGLIRAALCLDRRMLPALPGWSAPRQPELWARTPFFVPGEAQPWFAPAGGGPRRAAVSGLARDGACAHVLLAEAPSAGPARTIIGGPGRPALFPLAAADAAGLRAQLAALEQEARDGAPLQAMSQARLAAAEGAGAAPYGLALIAATRDELLREIALAGDGLAQALAQGRPWESPGGSAFAPRPLGGRGELALVYPGAFTSYPGVGRGLLLAFPGLHGVLGALTADPGAMTADRRLYPRSARRADQAEHERRAAQLRADARAMIAAGTSFATVATALLRGPFGLRPGVAFGYSMGEASMYWALGLWRDAERSLARLAETPLFNESLTGRRTAARAYLGDVAADDDDFWQVYVVRASAEQARARLAGERRAFLTHINTPGEVVIAGARAALPPILADLGGEQFRAPFDTVIHCPPVERELEALVALHQLPVVATTEVRRYSAADYAPTGLGADEIARKVALATARPVDFPRLVERVYADGARIFVEVGPGQSCTRWLGEILRGREHAALALNRRGASDDALLLQLLARLFAQRVPLNLGPLLQAAAPPPRLPRLVTVGGVSVADTIVSEEGRLMVQHAQLAAREPEPPAGPHQGAAPEAPAGDERPAPAYAALLAERRSAFLALADAAEAALQSAVAPPARRPDVIWDEGELLEFAQGSIARVFGPEYAPIDGYGRRVRLPLPPYLLVSRVTKLAARRGDFSPCTITTEYDIPTGAWYSVDGQIPWAVSVESGQCDLLLISYLGIDFQCRGERIYRLLDCTLTFLDDLPKEGETLRYDISINSFARNGDTLLFFFSYECFVGERMVLRMDGGCAGFFTDAELAGGRGVVDTERELAARRGAVRQHFAALLDCPRRSFGADDLRLLSAGEPARVFGPAYAARGLNPSLRLPPPAMLMLDRIVSVEPQGGAWGLGLVIAEKELAPDDWYFPCHFKDDQVLAGSLMAEGCGQLLQFYMLFLGLQTQSSDARFQPVAGLPQAVRCRGQVTPANRLLTYRLEVTAVGLEPAPYAHANVDIIVDGKTVVRFANLGLRLSEKDPRIAPPAARPAAQRAGPLVADERQITEFATGSLAACFGPDYAVYDTRRAPRTPNAELQLISRIVAVEGKRGEPRAGATLQSELDVPVNPWYCRENSYPETPYSVLMEIGLQPCGFLSAWLGSTLPYPEHDFYFRNLDGSGELLRPVDLRGKTVENRVTMTASTAIDGVIIQKFTYALACDGEPFFRGDAAFGYFTHGSLAKQVGLDGGKSSRPWLTAGQGVEVALDDRACPLYAARGGRLHERLPLGRFDLLDRAVVVAGGGRHGQGYVYGSRRVNPADWFFRCHFHQDPVMPGSLGVEAMLRALQAYALQSGLTAGLRAPRFALPAGGRCVWKYRGQIPAGPSTMSLELHLSRVERGEGRLLLVSEGSLWRDDLRIYELKDLALAIEETHDL